MVNPSDFIVRLEKILHYYGLSAAVFADKIGVQRSSISHLLKGRNKPSLEFVLKVVACFPEVNLYWLLKGEGNFPSATPIVENDAFQNIPKKKIVKPRLEEEKKSIEKIIIFYTDGSFKSYHEEK